MQIENAFVKAFNVKVGAKKTKLTIIAPLTPALARTLRVHSAVYATDNTPKQEIVEAELAVQKSAPFDLRLEVANISHVLQIPACEEALEWIAKRKGSTKQGKASKLLIEFKVRFTGSALGVFEWLEKYGQAPGNLSLTSTAPEQQPLKAESPKKAKGAAVGGERVQ